MSERTYVVFHEHGWGIELEIHLGAPYGMKDDLLDKEYTFERLSRLPEAPKDLHSDSSFYLNYDKKINTPDGQLLNIRVIIEGWRETSVQHDHRFYGIYLLEKT